ncbi:hypothetical protein [Nocardioides sp.]|uniref:hypothetical protein n=1 Tax=Nocardioides sp. TaxID=35761 RepID=UPI003D0BE063
MKYLLAAFEAAFCTVCVYLICGLVLFVTSANVAIPGLMTATSQTQDGKLETSLDFHPVAGVVIFVVLTLVFAFAHRAVGQRSDRSDSVLAR